MFTEYQWFKNSPLDVIFDLVLQLPQDHTIGDELHLPCILMELNAIIKSNL